MTIRARLLWLVLALALPLAAIAGAGLFASYRSERKATEALLLETARALSLATDREVGKAAVVLDVLAHSTRLRERDFAGFDVLARRVTQGSDRWIALLTPDGQFLVNTASAPGAPLPVTARAEAIRRIAESGQPELSGVFLGTITRQPLLVLELPVLLDGQVQYVLGMGLPVESFHRLAEGLALAPGWIATIVDRDGKVVSRSQDHTRFTGVPGPENFLRAIAEQQTGAVETVSLNGAPILASFSRAPEYGLIAAVSYPLAEFGVTIRRSLWWMLALLGVAVAGLAAALSTARTIASGITGLLGSAQDLQDGRSVVPLHTGVREVDQLGKEIAEAARFRHAAGATARESEVRLRLAMEAGELGDWEYDIETGAFTASPSCKAKFGRGADDRFTYQDLLAAIHPDDRQRQMRIVSAAIADRAPFEIEYRAIWPDASLHWVQIRGRAFERAGAWRLIGVSQDVTARKTAEDQQALLMHELNHRVKNTLATVQSIATMTFRSAADAGAAWETFQGRILGMAKTHDLLTASHWEGVPLRQLLEGELDPYQDLMRQRVGLRGNPVMLGPKAALALGLAVHELATNAAKYGCLSVPEGRLSVRWSIVKIEGLPHLLVEWTESRGPAVVPPSRQGFGTRLIQRGLTQELDGTIKLHFDPTGLHCVLTFPLHRVEKSEAPSPAAHADRQPF